MQAGSSYDEGTIVRYKNGDAFVKQVYEQLKPKSSRVPVSET